MVESKRRRHERRTSLNLVDYVVLDEEGHFITRGMGRTRNVSEGGLLLETHGPLTQDQTVLVTVGLEEDLVELKGKVIYTTPSEENLYWSGIEFLEIDDRGRQVLKPYIIAIETGIEE